MIRRRPVSSRIHHHHHHQNLEGNVRSHMHTTAVRRSSREMNTRNSSRPCTNASLSIRGNDPFATTTTKDEDWIQWYESIYTPMEWISLAVQFDAAAAACKDEEEAEQRLREPLESGRWYHDAEPFRKAMDQLLASFIVRKFPPRKNIPLVVSSSSSMIPNDGGALTPIILSGWMTIYHHRRQQQQSMNPNDVLELLSTCQGLRRVALTRLQRQRRRRKLVRIWMAAFVAVLGVAWLEQTAIAWRSKLLQVGGIVILDDNDDGRGCWEFSPAYYDACRIAQVHWLVTTLHHNAAATAAATNTFKRTDNSNSNSDNDPSQSIHVPSDIDAEGVRLHTMLYRSLITRDELYKSSFSPPNRGPSSRLPSRESSPFSSPVNQIVMNVLQKHGPVHHRSRDHHVVLDVGCGVGSFLHYYLHHRDSNPNTFVVDEYHGISASMAEIIMARRMFQQHRHYLLQAQNQRIDRTKSQNVNITFDRASFDAILPTQTYTAIIAIESLSFSRNLENTVNNLVQSLKPGGIMVIVEDVAYGGTEEYEANDLNTIVRPSLVSHPTWMATLESRHCRVVVARDLSLEYEPIIQALSLSSCGTWFPFSHFLFGESFTATGWQWWLNAPMEFWKASHGDKASQRLIELVQTDHPLYRSMQKSRQEGYQAARLSYNLYACIKQ